MSEVERSLEKEKAKIENDKGIFLLPSISMFLRDDYFRGTGKFSRVSL